MTGEIESPPPDLWVHEESVILLASTHDVWNFTPEFLFGMVPDNWTCRHASRTPEEAVVEYDNVNWRMTEEQLWISAYPESSMSDVSVDSIVPRMARKYLEMVPYLPFERVWFYWRISVVKTARLGRILEDFLPGDWPSEFKVVLKRTQPMLQFESEHHRFQMTLRGQAVEHNGETLPDAVNFDCFAFPTANQSLDVAIAEISNWAIRWQTLRRAVLHLV